MYRENNIDFRIASADAIGKFKTTQAHSFLQVCRKEFDFDLSSREVVLLSYDRFSSWLMQMEKAFLREEQKMPSKKLRDLAVSTFADELFKIEGICMENDRVFSGAVVEFLKVIHSYAIPIMCDGVDRALDASSPRAFANLATLVSDYLQHVLISMHEFNNNIVLKKEPFLCVARFCLVQRSVKTSCSLISLRTRAAYFRKKIHNSECVFTMKNYSDMDLSGEALTTLAEMGILSKSEEATA